MADLRKQLEAARSSVDSSSAVLVITDGVFSMEGDLAKLPEILKLAGEFDAAVFVDDSHGTGVLGARGRGTVEHFGLEGEIDVISSTLGKALGGAAGGYIASSRAVVDRCIQASRTHIFSNALPATIAASSLEALRLIDREPQLLEKLRENTARLREGLKGLGFSPLEGESAIIPIILGKTSFAIEMSRRLLAEGVFVTGFGYPVVPEGSARVRVQASAALEERDIELALAAFERVGRDLGLTG
jgi:glycine C-acetyltransferase